MNSVFFETSDFHCDLSDVFKHSRVEYSGVRPETVEKQRHALICWEKERWKLKETFLFEREEIEKFQLKRLQRIVKHAFSTTGFYRKLYSKVGFEPGDLKSLDDFSRLPRVSRDDLIAQFPHGIVSSGVDLDTCRWIRSSGSSGKPVQMVVSQRRADLDIFFKYRQFEVMGDLVLKPDRWIYNIHHSLWWYSSFLSKYPVFTLGQECDPEQLLSHIKALKPQVISTLASALVELSELEPDLSKFGVELIATNSETSTIGERKRYEKIFGVPVRDEYSSEELDIIAHECSERNYHLVEDDCYFELDDLDGESNGRVIGTDLWNEVMPVIRYVQDDLVEMGEGSRCGCGSHNRIIKTLHGRTDQAFISSVKGRVSPGNLMELCDQFLTPQESGILEYRLVQKSLDGVELYAVPRVKSREINRESLAKVERSLQRLMGYEVNLETRLVDQIPPKSSYKRRTMICEVS